MTSFIVVTKVLCWECLGEIRQDWGAHWEVMSGSSRTVTEVVSTSLHPSHPRFPPGCFTDTPGTFLPQGPCLCRPCQGATPGAPLTCFLYAFTSLLGCCLPAGLARQRPSQPPSRSVPHFHFRASSLACATCQCNHAVPRSFGCTVCVSPFAIGQVLGLQQPAPRPRGAA